MILNRQKYYSVLFSFLTLFGNQTYSQTQDGIPKPEYQLVDENNVDLLSKQLNVQIPGVSIGSGQFTLAHQLSSYGSTLYNTVDNYASASIYFAMKYTGHLEYRYAKYMIVRSPAGTAQFMLDDNNQLVGMKSSQGSTQGKVVEEGNRIIVTYPNGTIARYFRVQDTQLSEYGYANEEVAAQAVANRGSPYQDQLVARLEELIYPNGYTITLHREGRTGTSVSSITTNTGLQLKYVDLPDYDSSVYAINNTVSACSHNYTVSCDLEGWPSITYTWSPRNAIDFIARNQPDEFTFTATDSMGLATEYHHIPYDVNEGATNSLYPLGRYYVWRLNERKEPSGKITRYSYVNVVASRASGSSTATGHDYVSQPAVISSVSTETYTKGYTAYDRPAFTYANNYYRRYSSGYRSRDFIFFTGMGSLVTATDNASYTNYRFEEDWSNSISEVLSPEGHFRYEYDEHKRLIKRTHGADENAAENIDLIAVYPSTCDNYKICNQPTQYIDGKGNTTDFQYHPESGQIAVVTGPANRSGIRPQTRYFYEQKHAWYLDVNGSLKKDDRPVWLLVKESTCKVGAASGNGCALANDEIITTYDYGPEGVANNLHLKGLAVTADGNTRLTCYEYNQYGHRISETLPKGTAGSCP
ncbi:hypothetical protein [Marinibactrum halimedae]|uniref:RHS repeat protein n=1 Tax=Marinibactrum halimedae TaxID=1444977 RepID=A0AA37TAE8_9GAMM|nr:hypothetical protein [Marinibactrum halimedae]MCD9461203.1 hypothetical protein [Marinibactrum halimedae]GLS26425.1 hypothetical protein GCM10007877_21410 [Marinibactrum halimedae]